MQGTIDFEGGIRAHVRHASARVGFLLPLLLCAWAASGCASDDGERSTGREAADTVDTSIGGAFPAAGCSGDPTPAQVEGPFFTEDAPRKSDLAQDVDDEGTVAVITGSVFGADCTPRRGLRIDFWQTDANGSYDNEGYRLRGYQTTDDRGAFRVRTILPGEYTGRTEHIHVKIRDGERRTELLTTQLYVPGISSAAEDIGIFDEQNLLTVVDDDATPRQYRFDFVLPPER